MASARAGDPAPAMADPHDPGSPLAGVEMPVAPPTRPVDDDGPLPSTNRPDPAPPDSQASPDDGGPDAPDAPARPPRRPRRWWLLAAVPAVLVLVAVALGDQRRWPVLADAAVADGTALRIVPHAYGAEADAVQRVERVGPDGTDAIAMSFAIGPQQLEQVAGSPAGWIAAVVFAWDDGRPNGRSLWRQAPDGTTSELGPVDALDALVGVTDDGAVTIGPAPTPVGSAPGAPTASPSARSRVATSTTATRTASTSPPPRSTPRPASWPPCCDPTSRAAGPDDRPRSSASPPTARSCSGPGPTRRPTG